MVQHTSDALAWSLGYDRLNAVIPVHGVAREFPSCQAWTFGISTRMKTELQSKTTCI